MLRADVGYLMTLRCNHDDITLRYNHDDRDG